MTDGRKKEHGAGVLAYLKKAFLFRWNLLVFLGATAAAALSPVPDVLLPLVGAAELTFLTALTSVPRFRAAVDAEAWAESKAKSTERRASAGSPSLDDLLEGLDKEAFERFQKLRRRCVEMQRLARGVRGGGGSSRADEIRTPALDRLLWVFLKLLYSEHALERFLVATDSTAIKRQLDDLKKREAATRERNDERLLRSLQDSLATTELRLENYRKAESNYEFVKVELDRIEGKIQILTEMAVTHQDPDYISSQVDSVAESMTQTEVAIRELHHITGLADELEAPPPILETLGEGGGKRR